MENHWLLPARTVPYDRKLTAMTTLEIPERAERAACEAYDNAVAYGEAKALRAGAPIVVAARLRMWADECETRSDYHARSGHHKVFAALFELAFDLRQDADTLDPEGATT